MIPKCPKCNKEGLENNEELWKQKGWHEHGWWEQLKYYCEECNVFWNNDNLYIQPSGDGFAMTIKGEQL